MSKLFRIAVVFLISASLCAMDGNQPNAPQNSNVSALQRARQFFSSMPNPLSSMPSASTVMGSLANFAKSKMTLQAPKTGSGGSPGSGSGLSVSNLVKLASLFSGNKPTKPLDPALQKAVSQAKKIAHAVNPEAILAEIERRKEQAEEAKLAAHQEALEKQNTVIWQKILHTYIEPAYAIVQFGDDADVNKQQTIVSPEDAARAVKQSTSFWPVKILKEYPAEPINLSVGLYNRDLIEGPVFIAHMAADCVLYKKLKNIRIEHIFKQLKEDHIEFEKLFSKTICALEGFNASYSQKNIFKRLFSNYYEQHAEIRKPLDAYLNEKLTCFKFNPLKPHSLFRKEILIPLTLRLGIEKIGDAIVDTYIKKDRIFEPLSNKPLPQALEDAFKLKDGKRVLDEDPPLSLVTLAKALFDYRSFFHLFCGKPNNDNSVITISRLNKLCGWGLENYKLFNLLMTPTVQKIGSHASQLLAISLAAKTSDENYQTQWVQYIYKNSAELIALLRKYRLAKAEITEDLDKKAKAVHAVELELKNYIIKAHQNSSFIPWAPVTQWMANRVTAQNTLASRLSYPALAYIGWKVGSHVYSWYKNNNNENN